MSLVVHSLPALKDNFIYILADPHTDEALVIDPGDAAPVEAFLSAKKLKLTQILCTHHHLDHIAGAARLSQLFGAPMTCSSFDLHRIQGASLGLVDGQRVSVLGETMQAIAVPGHTDGQIALWFKDLGWLFAGDTIFSGGCGRLFEGSFAQMFASLDRLKKLPLNTAIYFGHEYTVNNMKFVLQTTRDPQLLIAAQNHLAECEAKLLHGQQTTPTTLERELQVNPFLMATTLEDFSFWRQARNTW